MEKGGSILERREARLAFWMLLPTTAVVLLFVVFPVIWNVWLSLKPVGLADLRGGELLSPEFTLGNFRKVTSDPDFPLVLVTTLVYTVAGSGLSVLLGLAAALLVHGEIPGRALFRGLFLAPYVAPVVAVAFTWGFILDPQLGVVNALGMSHGLLDRPVAFLSQRWYELSVAGISFRVPLALTSVILFEGWRYFPFAFLFLLARLQAVPEDLYSAARADGAGPFQRFRHVTLPQLKAVIYTLFLFRFIWTINKFDDIFLLTRGQAGTRVLTLEVYEYAFGAADIGAACAVAMILFGVLAAFIAVYLRWLNPG